MTSSRTTMTSKKIDVTLGSGDVHASVSSCPGGKPSGSPSGILRGAPPHSLPPWRPAGLRGLCGHCTALHLALCYVTVEKDIPGRATTFHSLVHWFTGNRAPPSWFRRRWLSVTLLSRCPHEHGSCSPRRNPFGSSIALYTPRFARSFVVLGHCATLPHCGLNGGRIAIRPCAVF